MPLVGFEPTIPASKRAKTIHALDPKAGHCDWQLTTLVTIKFTNWLAYYVANPVNDLVTDELAGWYTTDPTNTD
jgi:hypothetical protein